MHSIGNVQRKPKICIYLWDYRGLVDSIDELVGGLDSHLSPSDPAEVRLLQWLRCFYSTASTVIYLQLKLFDK